jgi:thioester reductase-like protein
VTTRLFFTGIPGFIGSTLLPLLLDDDRRARATCLVQARFLPVAEAWRDQLEPAAAKRVELVVGDITEPDLGLAPDERERLQEETTHVWHLAAVYDPEVSREVAMRINVDGTVHVLAFARGCAALRRLHYVSTCYVSGHYAGVFTETDLAKGCDFRNHYVESKHLAEVEVRRAMDAGLAATVYRPGMVVGDSTTGATQKFDGPYLFIRWLLRQPGPIALLPTVSDPHRLRMNIVPSDYLVSAVHHLSRLDASLGVTYQLADPDPPTLAEFADMLGRVLDRRIVRVPLPHFVLRGALAAVSPLRRLTGIPAEAIDYLDHPTIYTALNTQRDLDGSGITFPPLESYLDALVAFVRDHPEIDASAMV